MLKILKINIPLQLKADPDDLEDIKDRLFCFLENAIEEQELDFEVLEDEEEVENED